ncbi:CoA transferase subunit A [Zavarzinia sp.]|uniref:CoA transferase subunit A n=1 Tax=Zavarzinia sp. TaxID=2027920 RepID=UPI003564E85D
MDKSMTLAEMVATLEDGMTIGIGGWGARRKPMALVREILRSDVKDLTVVSYGGQDIGLLAASGKLKKLVFGFVSLDMIPLDNHYRSARQAGSFETLEIDEGMLQWGLRAAAMRLPFLPTRAGLGTDVETLNGELRTVTSPYDDGEVLVAMPALTLDAAFVHANAADRLGNAIVTAPDPFFDEWFCRAADKAFVTCDRLVSTAELGGMPGMRHHLVERSCVTGVAHVPFGAHPTSSGPDYGFDLKHLKDYNEAGFGDWRARFVDGIDHDAYLAAVGGPEKIAALPLPVF